MPGRVGRPPRHHIDYVLGPLDMLFEEQRVRIVNKLAAISNSIVEDELTAGVPDHFPKWLLEKIGIVENRGIAKHYSGPKHGGQE